MHCGLSSSSDVTHEDTWNTHPRRKSTKGRPESWTQGGRKEDDVESTLKIKGRILSFQSQFCLGSFE